MSSKDYFVFVEPIGPNNEIRTLIPTANQSSEFDSDREHDSFGSFSKKAGSQLYLGANFLELADIDPYGEDDFNISLVPRPPSGVED